MTGVQLATLSTALWVVATVSLFILLAGWSNGESWGLTASIVRGIRGWPEDDQPTTTAASPVVEPTFPILVAKRPIGGVAAARLPSVESQPTVELVDHGERRLPR